MLVIFSGLPLAAVGLLHLWVLAGGWWLVGVFFVNWIVDASIFAMTLTPWGCRDYQPRCIRDGL